MVDLSTNHVDTASWRIGDLIKICFNCVTRLSFMIVFLFISVSHNPISTEQTGINLGIEDYYGNYE